MPITKKIHFIWAGGEKLLPEENVQRIKTWAAKHPDFETYLWVDKETTSKEKLDQYYARYKFNEAPKIVLVDITEEAVVDGYSRYHIDGLVPNYGASSDILRYSILSKYGGAYFDSDVLATEDTKPLNHDGLFDSSETEILRITQFTQNHNAIGNDAIICTPDHPFIIDLYEAAKKNHQSTTAAVSSSPYKFGNLINVMNWTIQTTGPGVLQAVCLRHDMLEETNSITNESKIELTYANGKSYYQKTKDASLKLDQACYMPAKHNDCNWLKSLPRKLNDIEEAIKITMKSIRFEIKYMGLLRIDDHITNIVKALDKKSTINDLNRSIGDPTQEENEIAVRLIRELIQSELDLTNCKLVQLITRYQCVADYYQNFTPMLHDGDIDSSLAAMENAIREVDKKTRQFITYNYLSHIYSQVKACINTCAPVDKSHVQKLAKSHIVNIIEDYITEECDLLLDKDNLFGLHKIGLLSQDVDWLMALINTLSNIIKFVSENNKKPDESILKKMIDEHLVNFPDDKYLITTTLHTLYENEIVFDKKKIILDKDLARMIDRVRNEILRRRTKIKETEIKSSINTDKPSSMFSPISSALFHQEQTHLQAQEIKTSPLCESNVKIGVFYPQ